MPDDKKRKILVFSTAYYPFVAGAEIAIKEITDRLGGEFEFDLITAKMDKKLSDYEKIGNVNVHRIGGFGVTIDKLLLPFRGFRYANKLTKNKKYYCIWGMMITFGSGAGYLLDIYKIFTFQKRIPIVLSLQEGDSETHLRFKWFGILGLSWKLALKQTHYLTGLSNFLLKRAKDVGYGGESFLVPNGVDLSVFSREIDEERKKEIKLLLNKNNNEVFLVTWSRLTHKNAVDDIISALTYLPENISLIIMGKGEEGPKLQKQVDALNLSNRVKFLGFVPHNEIPDFLSVCDIFIRPSRSEGFGNSFIEAMAARLPVIATPVGGIPDFLTDNETGVFCSPDNPQSIAKAVNKILGDENLKTQIVKNAYERVVLRYDWNHISELMKQVFDKVSN
jgi:glycosyltransferase involved in cell wall biosynthesis